MIKVTYIGLQIWGGEMNFHMDLILAICVGIALSAAAGFRVFVPLLFTSVATHFSWITLSGGFEWVGSTPALIAFLVATIIEVLANYIPFVASGLKMLLTPLAILAGILLMASFIGEMDPFLRWAVSTVAGGGTAGLAHTTLATLKGMGETITLGILTPIISIIENMVAAVIPILVFLAPFLAVIITVVIALFLMKYGRRFIFKPQEV